MCFTVDFLRVWPRLRLSYTQRTEMFRVEFHFVVKRLPQHALEVNP